MAKRKIDIWTIISSTLLILLVALMVYSFLNTKNFKKDIKELTIERDSLQNILEKRSLYIDSLINIVHYKPELFDTIQYKKQVLNKIKKQYEAKFNSIDIISIDSNLIILTKYLSKKDSGW